MSGNVGIYAGTKLIHAGSPAKYVPDLMKQLKYHPLVKSCIFHCEFEYIHLLQMVMAELEDYGNYCFCRSGKR